MSFRRPPAFPAALGATFSHILTTRTFGCHTHCNTTRLGRAWLELKSRRAIIDVAPATVMYEYDFQICILHHGTRASTHTIRRLIEGETPIDQSINRRRRRRRRREERGGEATRKRSRSRRRRREERGGDAARKRSRSRRRRREERGGDATRKRSRSRRRMREERGGEATRKRGAWELLQFRRLEDGGDAQTQSQ